MKIGALDTGTVWEITTSEVQDKIDTEPCAVARDAVHNFSLSERLRAGGYSTCLNHPALPYI